MLKQLALMNQNSLVLRLASQNPHKQVRHDTQASATLLSMADTILLCR